MSLERRDPFARRLLVTAFSREAIFRPRARKSSDFRIFLMSGTPQCHFFAPPWTKLAEIGTFSTAFGYFRPVSGVALLSADASTCGFSKSLFSKQRFSASIVCRNTDFRNFCPQDARKVASGLSDGSEMANEAATPPHRPVAHRPITQRPIVPSSIVPRVGAAAVASRTGAPAVASRAGSRTHIHARGQPGRGIARARRRTPAVSSTMVARVSMAQEPTSCREELPPCPTRGRVPTTAPSSGW